ALRHSLLGALLLDCLGLVDPKAIDRFRESTGLDPLKDIDRIATADGLLTVSGFFDKAKWAELERESPGEGDGAGGSLHRLPVSVNEGPPMAFGTWRRQLLLFGEVDRVRRALDQVEGKIDPGPSPIPDEASYGEAYGSFSGA